MSGDAKPLPADVERKLVMDNRGWADARPRMSRCDDDRPRTAAQSNRSLSDDMPGSVEIGLVAGQDNRTLVL